VALVFSLMLKHLRNTTSEHQCEEKMRCVASNDQLPVDLVAQLVEHCTGTIEARVQAPFRPEFFRPVSCCSLVALPTSRDIYTHNVEIYEAPHYALEYKIPHQHRAKKTKT